MLTIDGWTVFLSIHDAAYMQELKRWRARLVEAHPDKGGSGTAFRRVMARKLAWQNDEAEWYAQLGLLPPDGFQGKLQKVERKRRLKGVG